MRQPAAISVSATGSLRPSIENAPGFGITTPKQKPRQPLPRSDQPTLQPWRAWRRCPAPQELAGRGLVDVELQTATAPRLDAGHRPRVGPDPVDHPDAEHQQDDDP